MTNIHPALDLMESTMKSVSNRHVAVIAFALALAGLGGCADVRQNPASNVVNGQSDAVASQSADAQPVRQSSVPF
jgi:hypothetical protein